MVSHQFYIFNLEINIFNFTNSDLDLDFISNFSGEKLKYEIYVQHNIYIYDIKEKYLSSFSNERKYIEYTIYSKMNHIRFTISQIEYGVRNISILLSLSNIYDVLNLFLINGSKSISWKLVNFTQNFYLPLIQYDLNKFKVLLLHGFAFRYNNKTVVVLGASQIGKTSYLTRSKIVDKVISDDMMYFCLNEIVGIQKNSSTLTNGIIKIKKQLKSFSDLFNKIYHGASQMDEIYYLSRTIQSINLRNQIYTDILNEYRNFASFGTFLSDEGKNLSDYLEEIVETFFRYYVILPENVINIECLDDINLFIESLDDAFEN